MIKSKLVGLYIGQNTVKVFVVGNKIRTEDQKGRYFYFDIWENDLAGSIEHAVIEHCKNVYDHWYDSDDLRLI